MEGLWSVRFRAGLSPDAYGVAVFHGDRILGGDPAFYWVGTLNLSGNQASVMIDARSHTGTAAINIFGQPTVGYSLKLTASIPASTPVGTTIKAIGPGGFAAELTRRA